MSNTVRNILLAALVIALGVNAYLLISNNDSDPQIKKVVESSSENAGKSADGAPYNTKMKAADSKIKTKDSFDPLSSQKESQTLNGPKTSITFAEYDHDFGNIQQDSENAYTFTFTNTGNEPLVIEKAKGSCGCTVPTYPKEPIAPGATGEIGVVYKPGKQKNNQTKKVTITANTDPVQTILTIKANVQVPNS